LVNILSFCRQIIPNEFPVSPFQILSNSLFTDHPTNKI
jgi:hypothetical protein